VFEKLTEILGEQEFTIAEFTKIITAGFEGSELALAPPSLDQLVVGDMRRSRFGSILGLICLGAVEGSLPASSPEGGLLGDEERAYLSNSGIELAKNSMARIHEEQFLIYASFVKPAEFLAISCHIGDLSGKPTMPARLLDKIVDMIPRISKIEFDKMESSMISNISSTAPTFAQLIQILRKFTEDEKPIPDIYLDALGLLINDTEYGEKLSFIYDTMDIFSKSDNLSRKSIEKLYGGRIRSSVSKLEKYNECAFAYFLRYNINAQRRRLYEVETIDIGNILHNILNDFAQNMISSDILTMDEGNIEKLAENSVAAIIEASDNGILKSSGKYMHFAQRVKEISISSTLALVEHLRRGDFNLFRNEMGFSDASELGFIDVALDSGAIMNLEGRIDRVDIMENNGNSFIKIIDYKSGSATFSLSEVYYGIQLQLLIYLGAFLSGLQRSKGADFIGEILPAAVFYFNLANPIIGFSKKLDDNPEAVRQNLLKEFRLSGIVLDENDVIFGLDREIAGDSDIIPVGLKKGVNAESEELDFKGSSMVVSRTGFDKFIQYSLNKAKKIGEDISKGFIPISPYTHKTRNSCRFCDYRSVCRFDPSLDGEKMRHLRPLSNIEVKEKIEGEGKI
ncbi:MAG: PD-(D/E)XK nuclease family protein, partial [Defluviitaleaceae bacterium]|nr:PD-(D/E)XK nuclease family protein [Defluviitaleaceae bacterium]